MDGDDLAVEGGSTRGGVKREKLRYRSITKDNGASAKEKDVAEKRGGSERGRS